MDVANQLGTDLAKQLSGPWFNQLGSRLDLQADVEGHLGGTIQSPVGGVRGSHPVTGYFDVGSGARDRAVGFAASWGSANSVTVWSGHYRGDEGVIVANWLLTTSEPGAGEWRSTLIGHDQFRRSPGGGGRADWASSAPQA
jgi:Avidin family